MNYQVYGLRLQSDIPLDGLTLSPFAAPPDITLSTTAFSAEIASAFEQVAKATSDDYDENVVISASEAGHAVVYRDGTRFFVHTGASRIDASWPEDSSPEDMATYLLGPLLAYVLRLRGVLCLHGSSVLIEQHAVVFAAPHGGGKSTTAARFSDRGDAVMSDDVVPVSWRGESPFAHGGYPRLRLWDESAKALYGEADALPRLTSTWTKRYLDLQAAPRTFAAGAHPISAIFILGARTAQGPSINRLRGHEAAMQLIANTSMGLHLEPAARVRELESIARLTASVPVYLAHAAEDLGRIDEFCDLIITVSAAAL